MAQHPSYNFKNLISIKGKNDLLLIAYPTAISLGVVLFTWLFFAIDFAFVMILPMAGAVYLNGKLIYDLTHPRIEAALAPITEAEKKESLEYIYWVFVGLSAFIPPCLAFGLFNSDITNGTQENQLVGIIVALLASCLASLASRLVPLDIEYQAKKQVDEEEELRRLL